MSPRGTPGTAAASPPPLANPCRLLALPVRALAALSSAGARSRLTSGFGYNATHAASAQPEAGAAPGRWTGPLAGEAEPQSFRDVPPAFLRPDPHRIPISAGAPNRLSHSAPKHAKRGGGEEKGEGGEGPRDPRDVARVTSEGDGVGEGIVFSPHCPRPSAASGLRLSGGGLSHSPSPAIGRRGASGPLQREKSPRRVERCLYKARHHLLPARPRAPRLGS